MSLDDRLRHGLPGLVDDLEEGPGSVHKVLASSRMRYRRRRTFGVLGTALLFAGGAVLAVADRDDSSSTEVLGTTITATTAASGGAAPEVSTTVQPAAPAGLPAAAGSGVTGEVSTRTTPCRVPLLVTKLPADYVSPLGATDDGRWLVRGASGHSLAIVAGAATPARAAGAAARTIDLPTLASKAEISSATDGSVLATVAMTDTRCGATATLVAQGMSDAELTTVLTGLRPETDCSAKGFVSAPAAQGADLPAAVVAARAKVRAAASACDFDALAALARVNPTFVAELRGVDLADQWRFADARGTQFMRAVVGLIDLVPRKSDPSIHAGSTSWVWPWFAFDDPTTKLVDADFATLDRIFGAGYGARFRGEYRKASLRDLAETYIGGLFVEIRADGTLAAITTR